MLLHGRNHEGLQETRAQCHQAHQHPLWQQDLNQTQQVADQLAQYLVEGKHTIAGFIHAAGIAKVAKTRLMPLDQVMDLFNVNFFAASEIVRVLLKKKINAGALNNILFISSIYSKMGSLGQAHYCASKAALDGYMRALALELAPQIRVNSILPGGVPTPMSQASFAKPGAMEHYLETYPMGLGDAGDIASMATWLCSEEARWITGQQFVVDGGRSIH